MFSFTTNNPVLLQILLKLN